MPWRRSSSSKSRGSMRIEWARMAMSEKRRPPRYSRRMVSATDRASVRASGAMTKVTGHSPGPLVATRSGSPAKSGSRRMNAVEHEVVEITQSFRRERVLVSAIDQVEHLDRLQLGLGRLARGGVDGRLPVLRVQLESALVESLRRDAPALQLEKEAEPGTQEVVEVVDAQPCERVRIEGCSLTASQARHQPLLEKPLSSLVEHAQLSRRPDKVGELVEQA